MGVIASGIPPFVTELSSGIVMFLFNFIILRLEGNTGVAAFGVITVISLVVVAIYTVIFFGASQLAFLFNSERNETLQALAVGGLKLYFLACPFIGFNIVTATYFTSTERLCPAQVISFLRGLFVLVPVAFLLSSILKMTGVWLAYPISECIAAMVGMGFFVVIAPCREERG